MKTNLQTGFSRLCNFLFSLTTRPARQKRYILLFAAVLVAGISSAISAPGDLYGSWVNISGNDAAENLPAVSTEITKSANSLTKQQVSNNGQAQPATDGPIETAADTSYASGADPVVPTANIIANYCITPGKVRLTATSTPADATYTWSTGETGTFIDVDIANLYTVVAHFSNGDSVVATRKVAEELVVNGDFSAGNTGFFSEYGYAPNVPGNAELYPEGLYGIGPDGQDYHPNFFGREHSTPGQTGNFLIVNGSTYPIGIPARQRIIWQQTVTVAPNTNYYFSAQAMNVNPNSPAELQFQVNGVLVGTIADLDFAAKPTSNGEVNRGNWIRFYSNPTWNSGSNTTATIQIVNRNLEANGNDFGLDDISFSTLSPFITLVSGKGTDGQTNCFNEPISPITYSVGSDSTGHSITGLPEGVTASFDVPNVLTLSGTPTSAGFYTYTITTTGTCNPVTVTGTINIPSVWNTWTGAVSTDWSDKNNWGCGAVPTAVTNACIPGNVLRMPKLSAASVCKMLKLQAFASLNLNGMCFTNFGGVSGTGVFIGSATSSLVIDAAGTSSSIVFNQLIPGSTNALANFTVKGNNDTVSVNARLAVYDVLAPKGGILTINDTLVLRSSGTGTARVDAVSGVIAYGVSGKVEVERYFPARRSWRMVTAPLAKAGTIFESWQNGGKFTTGKGTYVSGAGASFPICANGLDWSPMNNTSLKTALPFTAVLNTRVSLSKNLGDSSDNIPYFLFVRGDRNLINTTLDICNNTTLSSAGQLQTGSQTFNVSSTAGGYTFIGNPYASPVDFARLQLKNLKKHFIAWDANLNTEQGGYVLVEETSPGVYDVIPRSPGGLNRILQSSQAFFVETATNGPASITFLESSKSATTANLTAFRPMGIASSFRSNLYHLNGADSTVLLDGVMALFDSSFSSSVDDADVAKSTNPREMISLVRDAKMLALERRPAPGNDDTLFLRLNKTTQRRYRLEFEPAGLDPLLSAFLDDSYTNLKTVISISSNTVVDFEINADPASADANRFRIVFKRAKPLPVTFRTIHAKLQGADIAVTWTVDNEINIKNYEVERSADGISFSKLHTTAATGETTASYNWIDPAPFAGNNYYRVKNIGSDGQSDYSKTVLVTIADRTAGLQVTPNPSNGKTIGVAFNNIAEGVYGARLINALGQLLTTTEIKHTAGTTLEKIVPGKKLPAGIYNLMITKPDHSITSIKLIVD